MMDFTIIMCDTIMIATMKDNRWHVRCQDNMTGKSETAIWTNDEFASILALMMGVGEDNTPGFDHKTLYEVCEPLLAKWEKEVRPIP